MHFFTSINNNYLPKARVLASSVKKYHPNSKFTLLLADEFPQELQLAQEAFDEIFLIKDLGIPVTNLNLWIYQHTIVELCTAIKGQALVKALENGSEKVVYLDPDIVVFDTLTELEKLLDRYDIILTPHQTVPETNTRDIINNEICSLKHGIYNLGFLAVRNTFNGIAFARWWRDRLIEFCFDDIPNGLFTDQRWGDLIPALFNGVYIWKDPSCNVSTWNLTHRNVTKILSNFYVNGKSLKFYHFSGFDSGAQKVQLDLYGKGNPILYELRQWYIEQLNQHGQMTYGYPFYKSKYNYYDNGELIPTIARKLLRTRKDLLDYFSDIDPYITKQEKSYYSWYKNEMPHEKTVPHITIKQSEYDSLQQETHILSKKLEILSEQCARFKSSHCTL